MHGKIMEQILLGDMSRHMDDREVIRDSGFIMGKSCLTNLVAFYNGTIKVALASAQTLGLLDYSKSFELFVHENKGVTSRVVSQKLGTHRCPVAYYSTQLDPVVAGNNSCVKAIAATATIIKQ
ncbi:endogenous retrovirus group k member 18 pol [Limosa lapponica baueri]|uniref:Endogenous retrovirus group k member 18 pol n=1 Tax=Limosa lapponica baueri TaxID=1758121 RepID=A0A2I0T523_LIMLA|nr:endogenous retrovirus group k member 18 pol [Limosa lapponica baueri]